VSSAGSERTVFCVSDHTGVTAEVLAHSLMARFENIDAIYETRPFVDDSTKVDAVVAEIDAVNDGSSTPIIFSTIIDAELLDRLQHAEGLVIDLFGGFVGTLSTELEITPTAKIGRYHNIGDTANYEVRLDAVDYVLATDDGLGFNRYDDADVILVGVSRVGKTPTCLYLAMQYGIRAANFPLTSESLDDRRLPEVLEPHTERLFGLSIDPIQLFHIRQKRRPGGSYATLERCGSEVEAAERIFRTHRVPNLDTTARSIEEISANIIERVDLERRLD
jgi:regulator of PEP synthase PpsR (kinase-PPPase family)